MGLPICFCPFINSSQDILLRISSDTFTDSKLSTRYLLWKDTDKLEGKQNPIGTSRAKTKTVKQRPAQPSSEDVVMVDVQQVNPPPEIDIPNLRFLRRVRREAHFGTKKEKRQVVKVSENWLGTDMELLGIVWYVRIP
ncbi:hypothetical protein NW766_001668 [Fusarium irregulare]|uniref:Uncharacterized protein n=1 Tax=Fusarium irregulare TaxID=2494466 RepID=A0A9W8Q0R7_9HYPO|nr:hypothetical protein NW766_001668 [Fusarium irregulare]